MIFLKEILVAVLKYFSIEILKGLFTKAGKTVSFHKKELLRFIPMLSLTVFFFTGDVLASGPLIMATSFIIAFTGLSHILRKMLFPYIDMKEYACKGLETSIGAAIVFFAIALLLMTLMLCAALIIAL